MKEFNEAFYNWLNECPVQWLKSCEDEDRTSYIFIKEDEVEE